MSSLLDGAAASVAPLAPAQLSGAQPATYGIWASVTEGRIAPRRLD